MHNPSAFAFHLVSLVLTIPALFLNVEAFRLLGRLRTRLNPVMASYCWMLVSDFLLLIALTLRSGILVMWRPQDEDITPGLGTFTTFVIYTCLGAQSMGTLLIGIATLRMVVEVDTSQQERAVFHTIGWATGIVLGALAIASSEFVLKEGIFFVANADRKHDGLGVAVIVIVLFTVLCVSLTYRRLLEVIRARVAYHQSLLAPNPRTNPRGVSVSSSSSLKAKYSSQGSMERTSDLVNHSPRTTVSLPKNRVTQSSVTGGVVNRRLLRVFVALITDGLLLIALYCITYLPVAILPFISAPGHVASFCLGLLICVQPVVDTAVQYRTLRKVTTQMQRVWVDSGHNFESNSGPTPSQLEYNAETSRGLSARDAASPKPKEGFVPRHSLIQSRNTSAAPTMAEPEEAPAPYWGADEELMASARRTLRDNTPPPNPSSEPSISEHTTLPSAPVPPLPTSPSPVLSPLSNPGIRQGKLPPLVPMLSPMLSPLNLSNVRGVASPPLTSSERIVSMYLSSSSSPMRATNSAAHTGDLARSSSREVGSFLTSYRIMTDRLEGPGSLTATTPELSNAGLQQLAFATRSLSRAETAHAMSLSFGAEDGGAALEAGGEWGGGEGGLQGPVPEAQARTTWLARSLNYGF